MIKLLGLLGGACFALCGVPAALHSFRGTNHTPASVAWLIFVGACSMFAYLFASFGFDLVVTASYVVEIGSWGAVLWWHYRPRAGRQYGGNVPCGTLERGQVRTLHRAHLTSHNTETACDSD